MKFGVFLNVGVYIPACMEVCQAQNQFVQPLNRFGSHLFGGMPDGIALQHTSHIVNLIDIIDGKAFYKNTFVGEVHGQSLVHQLPQRFPNRGTADAQSACQLRFLQPVTWRKGAITDLVLDNLVHLTFNRHNRLFACRHFYCFLSKKSCVFIIISQE